MDCDAAAEVGDQDGGGVDGCILKQCLDPIQPSCQHTKKQYYDEKLKNYTVLVFFYIYIN